jgi:hypothetical protein
VDRTALKTLHLAPLGIPTLVISDDPQLIAAAASAYSYWSVEAPVSEPSVELRLETADASPIDKVCLDITVEGSRLRLTGLGAKGVADATTRKAHAYLPMGVAGDPGAFVEVVDTLLLFILARNGRTPVHASAFMLDNLAILLAGPSGSGKSSLAHAASVRGFPVLSEDMIFVQGEPSFAVWGFPRPIHLLPADAPPGDHPIRTRNGKHKASVPAPRVQVRSEQSALLILARGESIQLRQISGREAVRALMKLDEGFDLLEKESRAAAEELARHGPWRLTLSDDAGAAVDLVARHFGRRR